MNRFIVLDTNCLLQSISQRSTFYRVWKDFVDGCYVLCITNDILEEYEEIVASHMSPFAARIVVETILRANNVLRVDASTKATPSAMAAAAALSPPA